MEEPTVLYDFLDGGIRGDSLLMKHGNWGWLIEFQENGRDRRMKVYLGLESRKPERLLTEVGAG